MHDPRIKHTIMKECAPRNLWNWISLTRGRALTDEPGYSNVLRNERINVSLYRRGQACHQMTASRIRNNQSLSACCNKSIEAAFERSDVIPNWLNYGSNVRTSNQFCLLFNTKQLVPFTPKIRVVTHP